MYHSIRGKCYLLVYVFCSGSKSSHQQWPLLGCPHQRQKSSIYLWNPHGFSFCPVFHSSCSNPASVRAPSSNLSRQSWTRFCVLCPESRRNNEGSKGKGETTAYIDQSPVVSPDGSNTHVQCVELTVTLSVSLQVPTLVVARLAKLFEKPLALLFRDPVMITSLKQAAILILSTSPPSKNMNEWEASANHLS